MSQWQVAAELIYGQVKNISRRRKLVRVTPLSWSRGRDWVSQDD